MWLANFTGQVLSFVARLITGAQGHWYGCPPKAEQRIYFANHQSHFDWVLIWAALPHDLRAHTRPIAARDYWGKGGFKTWLTSAVFNAVYVSRQRTADEDPLEPLAEALRHGDSLVIFPEGTRNNKGEPQAFKAGLYHLAQQFPDVQLIPTWIDNVHRVMPKGEVVPVPILCSVTFGCPIQLHSGEDKAAFLARARRDVWDLHGIQATAILPAAAFAEAETTAAVSSTDGAAVSGTERAGRTEPVLDALPEPDAASAGAPADTGPTHP